VKPLQLTVRLFL